MNLDRFQLKDRIWKTLNKNIVFVNIFILVADEYKPKPSSSFIPNWYKEIESYTPKNEQRNLDNTSTIKKCMPVFDSITAGYIIVSPCDVIVTFQDGEPQYESKIPGIITHHSTQQAYTHPTMNNFSFPKWVNPWSITTPKGYSILIKNPSHNPNPWFEILEGIVDTDTYNSTVNFPFILKNPKQKCFIPAGTPIAQIIPIKREKWTHSFSKEKETPLEHNKIITSVFFHAYKNKFWQRKEYK